VGNRIIVPSSGQLSLSQESTIPADSGAPGSALSKEEIDALVWQTHEQMLAGGWTRYGGGSPGVPGVVVPSEGWVRLSPGSSPWDQFRTAYDKGIAVYDRPDGEIVGYEFANLGFVPRSIAESPGFDPQAARAQKFGCDLSDNLCASRIAGQPAGSP
jgi:hypothetical protein